ncbi:NUDIX domain-containing protein [Patescibacteria group bacterium]|nr:NUDIX domain-containing protein [Patescibacteria group bacterium]
MNKKIKVRVRLIIIKDGHILLSHNTRDKFYYYVGGKVEFRETLAEAAKREVREEADADFTFGKILYIREFIPSDDPTEHSAEFFILGDVDKFAGIHGRNDDLATAETCLEWIKLDDLKKINVLPARLTDLVLAGHKSGFKEEIKYLGRFD